jgi:glutathione S-transferase
MIELWHEWNSVQSFKVRVMLAEKDLPWTEHRVELLKFEHLRPEYLALNPNGVVPTLVHDGLVVLESSVICQYLDEAFPAPALMPRDPYARAKARTWLKIFDDVAHAPLRQASFELLYRPYLARMPRDVLEYWLAGHPSPARAQRFRAAAGGAPDRAAVKEAAASCRAILARMDGELRQNEWLGGAQYSLADVAMSPFIERLDHLGMMDLLKLYPEAKRWSAAVMARPAVVTARAPVEYRLPIDVSSGLHELTGR